MGSAIRLTTPHEASQDCEASQVLVLPVLATIPIPACDPYTLYRALGIKTGYLLESMEGLPRRAVRSIIGLEPALTLSFGKEQTCEGDPRFAALFSAPKGQDPVSMLRDLSGRVVLQDPARPGFLGGFVGYCAYDMVSDLTGGKVCAGRSTGPLSRFMLSTRGIVYDHLRGVCMIFDDVLLSPDDHIPEKFAKAHDRIERLTEQIDAVSPGTAGQCREGCPEPPHFTSSLSREAFMDRVRRAQDSIMAGDILQVVLSRKITCPFVGDPLTVYGAIREINPSPYLYYLDFGDEVIIGSSPEMLVRSEGKEVQTVPIAGTRPRGRDSYEDERLAGELLADQKERAEHLMLVDLARNDIGRVSEFGSISLPEFFEIEKFSHVQHIVSRVKGIRADRFDRFDAFTACFPAGTVSGAPKVRAMQIIAELEPVPRGLYAGAVGYAGFNDILEFAIAIRTLRISNGIAEFSAGAGIVADSVPEREFEETEQKARAMVFAVCKAGGTV
ncbi:MAG: anthranilate synthase component I family protein [Methanoregulaceae archaeon]